MARKNLTQHVQKCDMCNFSSKNWYIYKRHRIRCRKEHGITKGKKTEAISVYQEEEKLDTPGMPFTGKTTPHRESHESGPELSSPESPSARDGATGELHDSTSIRKPAPHVSRNYQCTKCDLCTNRSRVFLYHLVEAHNYKIDIYACRECEYCSKYRHKVQRHMKFAHRLDIPYADIDSEYESAGKKRVIPKAQKIVPVTKQSGRKLTVKFARPGKGSTAKSGSPSKGSKSPSSKVPSVGSTDQLSKVVEEITGKDGSLTYKCRECPFVSDDKQKVAKHMVSWHVDIKHFNCSSCGYICFERNDFLAHRQTHRNEHQYKCEDCTYSTDFRPNFERHQNNHRGSFPFNCSFCTYGCGSDAAIRRHMALNHERVPSPVKKLKMSAPKAVASLSSVDQDQNCTDQVSTSHQSQDKSSPTKSKGQYKDSKVDSTFQIQWSPSKLSSDSSAATAVPRRTLPPPKLSNKNSPPKELSPMRKLPPNITQYVRHANGKLVCPACNHKGYSRSSDLNRHMKRKHACRLREFLESMPEEGLDPNLQSDFSELNASSQSTDDAFEDMEEDTEDDLNDSGEMPMELGTQSGNEDESPVPPGQLKCKYCNFEAKWPSDLRRHLVVHSIEKRYKCSFCPKKYKYIGDMNLHIRKDHNREPADVKVVKIATIPRKKTSPAIFKCPCCSYTSAWKSEVDRHSRLHTGEKTFQCSKCDYQTYWRGDIRRHVYKHHPELMTDGVAINDVIVFRKDRTPELVGSGQTDLQSEDGSLDGSTPSTFQPIPEWQTPESSPSKGDSSHESTPELNIDENYQRSEKSPTPSPIKELGGGMYQCLYCGFIANAPSKMNAHIATHNNLKRYMCPLCGRRANWKWDIAKHIKKDHSDDSAQVVKLSKKEAQTTIKTYIEAHSVVRRQNHLNSTPEKTPGPESSTQFFKCAACDFSAEKRISVSRHIRFMHEGEGVDILNIRRQSPVASKEKASPKNGKTSKSDISTPSDTLTPSKFTHLIDSHGPGEPSKPFMCSECGKRAATKGDVKKHYHYMHPDKEIRIIYLGNGSQAEIANGSSKSPHASHKAVSKPEHTPPKETAGKPSKPHGYIKPFKCPLCGRRSNWRWDMCKHIRERHPGQNVEMIELTEHEARATYQEYMEARYPHLKPLGTDQKKLNNEAESKEEVVAKAPKLSTQVERTAGKKTNKEYKCSACEYRSTWKPDVKWHWTRQHGGTRAKIVVSNKEDGKTNKNKESSVDDVPASEKTKPDISIGDSPQKESVRKVIVKKMWKCSVCTFISEEKVQALKHLSQHNIKPFNCIKCNMTSNFRSAVYKHIKAKHPGDESAVCKLAIKLIKKEQSLEKVRTAVLPETQEASVNTEKQAGDKTGLLAVYCCKLCAFRSQWRSCVCRHLRTAHKSKEYCENMSKRVIQAGTPRNKAAILTPSMLKNRKTIVTKAPASGLVTVGARPRPKNFACTICPYKAYKRKMLKFHMTCHKPQPGVKQVKCKYCPYYVNRNRLLAQHMTLHIQELKSTVPDPTFSYPVTPTKVHPRVPGSPVSNKRHKCEKCPYTSNSKNDYLYHKQFHRPKPTADYKCDYCDYWVTHRRLIKQHMKVHQLDEGFVRPSPVPTPTKSEYSENSLVYDTIEIAAIKQRIIASKITPSISQTPIVSPMKIASSCMLGGKRGFLRKDGTYRKIHKCRKCPYMNIRLRNMKLHELMHGKRSSTHPLLKCPHCDYFVGSKGLLGHHLKVHQPDYGAELMMHDKDKSDDTVSEDSEVDANSIPVQSKVDTLLEIARFKKYGCEKCPYASAKRMRFQRHVELHGSKQKYKCDYCDYSVPTTILLKQHQRLHFQPNQNLLAAQSILNLQHLPEMPADVALASMLTNNDSKHPVSVTHDHIDLYENAPEESEPKKIYRCDRCPYANIRRDHLLAHLRCHMIKNTFSCPYCDYSVGKIHVLMQHVKVHFSPLPELSEWLNENGDSERIKEIKEKNMQEAIELARLSQNDIQFDKKEDANSVAKRGETSFSVDGNSAESTGIEKKTSADQNALNGDLNDVKMEQELAKDQTEKQVKVENGTYGNNDSHTEDSKRDTKPGLKPDGTDDSGEDGDKMEVDNTADDQLTTQSVTEMKEMEGYVCQYCDRYFTTSDCLVRHEMQHLIGNSYEELVDQLLNPTKNQLEPEAGPSGISDIKSDQKEMQVDEEYVIISDDASKADNDETDTLKLSSSSNADEEEAMLLS